MNITKYIILFYVLNFISAESYISSICQVLNKRRFWDNSDSSSCSADNEVILNYWNHLQEKKQRSLWERLKRTTKCVSWKAFDDSNNEYSIPFENIINGAEDIVIDFINFYIDYFSQIINVIRSCKVLKFLVNPATILILALYLFHRKIFKPLIYHIQNGFGRDNDDPDNCSTCLIIKGNQMLTENED